MLKKADYSANFRSQQVEVTARFAIHSRTQSWQFIPLVSQAVGIKSAKIDGETLPLTLNHSMFGLLLAQKGSFSIELTFYLKPTKKSGPKKSAFKVVQSLLTTH